MSKRLFTLISLVAIASMLLAGCGGAGGGTIKVAILVPLSGDVVTFGESTRDGALLAIEEWNAKGGAAGMQIEYVIEDSQCSADPARNAANKVASEGIKYIIGEVCSSASIPISEVAQQKGIVQISPTSTNPKVTVNEDGTTKDYIFRACFIDPFQGKVGAKFALDNLGAKTAFILFNQGNDYVRGLAENFEASFTEGGGTIVGKETYIQEDTDFSAILAKVAEANPDIVYLPDYYSKVNLVTKQAKEKGVTAPFVGGDGWDSSDLDYAAAEGGYFTNHYSPEDTRPIVVDWLKKYGEKYEGATPDALATLAYDATNLLLAAIDKAGKDDPAAVKDAMKGLTWDGVSGTITFDAQNNPIKSAVILQVKDGRQVFVDSVAP
jgi:branched-chain amino acid transport system substrate-binding protein